MAEDQSNGATEQSPAEFVTLGELALEFKMPKSNLRRWAIDRGIAWHKRRVLGKGGNALQATLYAHEADKLRRLRREAGFMTSDTPQIAGPPPSEVGNFYVVAIVPELDPRRLKFGFATSINARLADHRTLAPTLQLLRSWPCQPHWERPAIDCLGVICRWIGGEVYQASDVQDVLDRAGQFFDLLPVPGEESDFPTDEELDSIPSPGATVRRYTSTDRLSWLEGVVEAFFDNPAGDCSREPELRVLFTSRVTDGLASEEPPTEQMVSMSEVEVVLPG